MIGEDFMGFLLYCFQSPVHVVSTGNQAWIRVRMWSISCSSAVFDFNSPLIFSHEWMTVVWSRPPNFSPMEGYETLNSSRRIYIIICRGFTTSFFRVFS